MERCELTKLVDWPAKPSPTVWGWALALMACSSYDEGFKYDWNTGKWKCLGDFRPALWRR